MKKHLLIFFLFFLMIKISLAVDLVGIGYGKSDKTAKNEALADLSSLIRVQVKSKYLAKYKNNDSKQNKEIKSVVLTESDLPILGVHYNTYVAAKEIMAEAKLDPENVRKLYERELNDIYKNIEQSVKQLGSVKTDSEKYEILTDLLTYIDSYEKYKAVAILIGIDNIKALPVTQAEVKSKLAALERSVSSISVGAKALLKDIKFDNIYIFPATTLDSQEITPFASVLKDKMLQNIKNPSSPKYADYFYRGSYVINKNSIDVTYKLTDKYGKTLRTKVVNFKKSAYKGYRVKPQTIDFDRLLHQGVVLSNKLRADVATNKGSRDLIFKKGQNIQILVKLNRAGFFYIVGHVNKPNEKYSYLLELNEGKGNRKFIQRVSADDANKWINLGEFEVVPPFGVENIQVIASNKDLIDSVPSNTYDDKLELYIVSDNPKKAVIKTRALKKKKSKKTYIAEAVLTFTTTGK